MPAWLFPNKEGIESHGQNRDRYRSYAHPCDVGDPADEGARRRTAARPNEDNTPDRPYDTADPRAPNSGKHRVRCP